MFLSRNKFLKIAGMGVASTLLPWSGSSNSAYPAAPDEKLKLGLASYTFHKFSLDQTLAATKRLNLKYIALKDMHMPMKSSASELKEIASKAKEAGIQLYGAGVIYMKSEDEVNQAFDYAKNAGLTTIIGVPNHELLPLVNKKVKEYNIKVAIHNHGPGDKVYPSPESIFTRIKSLDKRIGLCLDIGHTKRIGLDPSKMAQLFADRIYDVHIKDVTGSTAQDTPLEIGRGVIDIPAFLRTLIKIKYSGVVGFEYEKDAADPLPGLAESLGYVRGVLHMI